MCFAAPWIHIQRTLLLVSIIILSVAAASANPLADGKFIMHIVPTDPDFCQNHTITNCDQIIQNTQDTGLLDFVVFYNPWSMFPEQVEGAVLDLTWPEYWTFVQAEACNGVAITEAGADGALITITTDQPVGADEFFAVARITMDVPDSGRMLCVGEIAIPGGTYLFIEGSAGRAGVVCSGCTTPCEGGDLQCIPVFTPDMIHLTALQGDTAEGYFFGRANGWGEVTPCDFYVATEAEWLTYSITGDYTTGYDINVFADTSLLATGEHMAYLEAMTTFGCMNCFTVRLTVDHNSPVETKTWGQIKVQFK